MNSCGCLTFQFLFKFMIADQISIKMQNYSLWKQNRDRFEMKLASKSKTLSWNNVLAFVKRPFVVVLEIVANVIAPNIIEAVCVCVWIYREFEKWQNRKYENVRHFGHIWCENTKFRLVNIFSTAIREQRGYQCSSTRGYIAYTNYDHIHCSRDDLRGHTVFHSLAAEVDGDGDNISFPYDSSTLRTSHRTDSAEGKTTHEQCKCGKGNAFDPRCITSLFKARKRVHSISMNCFWLIGA